MKKLIVTVAFLWLLIAGFAQQAAVVKTEAGLVSGVVENEVHIFKGIPFAAPPVGNLRWKAPQPVAAWTGTKKCDVFSASAVQPAPVPFYLWSKEFMAALEPLSEDCLYLNVWTNSVSAKKPVIVWIHGGGFTGGSGSVPVYDGAAMAKRDVVFVTINYRLGVFGFLAHPELTKEAAYNASGNYALLDQVAAMQWVKNNIAAFGGDPERVTIAGQSAGAFSVCALMASPLAKGLFQRAIAESGGMFNVEGRAQQLKAAEQAGVQFAAKLNAASLAELRALPADQLLAAGGNISSPVIDGYLLPADVYTIFKSNSQNDVALITGWNTDEGFLPQIPMSADRFKESIEKKYGALAGEMLKAFPAGTDEEAKKSQKDMSRDQIFAWQNYTWATMQTATGKQKAWLYIFSQKPAGEPDNGAFHSAEIAYALHTLDKWNRPWTATDRKVENLMSSYWINFATTGDPNGAGLTVWPAVEPGKLKAMEFTRNSKVLINPLKKEMDVLDKNEALLRASKQ